MVRLKIETTQIMSRLQDNTGSYVRFLGGSGVDCIKGALIVSEVRWGYGGEEFRVRGLSDWLPSGLFELADKPTVHKQPSL